MSDSRAADIILQQLLTDQYGISCVEIKKSGRLSKLGTLTDALVVVFCCLEIPILKL